MDSKKICPSKGQYTGWLDSGSFCFVNLTWEAWAINFFVSTISPFFINNKLPGGKSCSRTIKSR